MRGTELFRKKNEEFTLTYALVFCTILQWGGGWTRDILLGNSPAILTDNLRFGTFLITWITVLFIPERLLNLVESRFVVVLQYYCI